MPFVAKYLGGDSDLVRIREAFLLGSQFTPIGDRCLSDLHADVAAISWPKQEDEGTTVIRNEDPEVALRLRGSVSYRRSTSVDLQLRQMLTKPYPRWVIAGAHLLSEQQRRLLHASHSDLQRPLGPARPTRRPWREPYEAAYPTAFTIASSRSGNSRRRFTRSAFRRSTMSVYSCVRPSRS